MLLNWIAGALRAARPLLPLWALLCAVPCLPARAAEKLQFNRDIRPILTENCYHCHGPDRANRQANLRLDQRDSALADGAIAPGKPGASKLIARIMAQDDAVMPPPSTHKTLTAAQKSLLRRWIAEGAVYQLHWAYIAPKRPPVPSVTAPAFFPVRNGVDAFILQRLAEKRITPSHEADRRTLLRRVSLDLTGLPPSPGELQSFLADRSPKAYEKVVDRLLRSPHYGERMAIGWLDLARYADTVGFHGDQNQNAWAYRDYVISSFNADKPFDRFTIEQLAGDLLPNPTPEQRAATCFVRLNMMTREGGAQVKEYLAKYTADRVRTVGMTWLGSTFNCCECHDHKYDPISQKDFYSMGAFFADVKQWGIYADYGYNNVPELRGFGNDSPFPPQIKVVSPYLQERIQRDRAGIAAVAQHLGGTIEADPKAKAAFDTWRQAGAGFLTRHPDGWAGASVPDTRFIPDNKPGLKTASADAKPAFQPAPDGSVLLTASDAGKLEMTLHPDTGSIAALRLEALPQAVNGGSVLRPGMSDATLTLTASLQHADGKRVGLGFRYAGANIYEPDYQGGSEVASIQGGWRLGADRVKEPHTSVWLLESPAVVAPGDTLVVSIPNAGAGVAAGGLCLRVAASPFEPESLGAPAMPSRLQDALANPTVSKEDTDLALTEYLAGAAPDAQQYARLKALDADMAGCHGGMTPVMVTEAATPLTMRVLPRGNWQDESGPIVDPALPHFLPGPAPEPGHRLTRLDLAKWLVSPQNPLTARVFVNRLWKQFFGNALSAQVEDLGTQGEWPSHPELLDWLAVEFREKGWDVKHMVRLIVTSSTYRQSSRLRPELNAIDPNNRLLASQNPRRLDAELIRDNALAIAGLLNPDVGGPPCWPYQPEGYYANIQFPDRTYVADKDESQYRRGVYMHWQRTFLHPMLANFDAPSREDCIAARNVSSTPLQSLTLLNDPEFVEAARVFACNLLDAKAGSDAARLNLAYQRALARPPTAREITSLLTFLRAMRANYRQTPGDAKKLLAIGNAPAPPQADPVELAAWTNVCRVILNLSETITRY